MIKSNGKGTVEWIVDRRKRDSDAETSPNDDEMVNSDDEPGQCSSDDMNENA